MDLAIQVVPLHKWVKTEKVNKGNDTSQCGQAQHGNSKVTITHASTPCQKQACGVTSYVW